MDIISLILNSAIITCAIIVVFSFIFITILTLKARKTQSPQEKSQPWYRQNGTQTIIYFALLALFTLFNCIRVLNIPNIPNWLYYTIIFPLSIILIIFAGYRLYNVFHNKNKQNTNS